jgi:NAD(P)-dependent dehydrogenase (short-subunit alcohol dehydrogenase family)
MLLQEHVAVITGAGQGIGLGIAETFCAQGAHVIIGELALERGRHAAEMLQAQGHSAQAILLDVTQSASCAALVDQVLAEHGRIDVLVNNAGLAILDRSENVPEEAWRRQIDVMLTGVFLMTQAVAQTMISRRKGSIVNIASIGGMGGWPMRAAYNAAKAGVIVLTEVLATEWAQHNIRLNCVSPGVTRTEMVDNAIRTGVVHLDNYVRRIPLGRLANVSEIAQAVLFLASERAQKITGANLRVDGGWVPWGNANGIGFPDGDDG